MNRLSAFFKTTAILITVGSQHFASAQITTAAPYCEFNANMTMSGSSGAISKVSLGTLNNVTAYGNLVSDYRANGCRQLYNYYNNVTAPGLTAGTSNTIELEFKSSYDGEPLWYAAYIDFNQNNLFDTASEMIIDMAHANINGFLPTGSYPNVLTTIRSNTFTVPANAVAGTTRMRVIRSQKDYIWRDSVSRVNPCKSYVATFGGGTWMFGEVEDYNVTIIAAAPSIPSMVSLSSTAVTTTTATLTGAVNANGTTAMAYFEYGTTTAYGNTFGATPASVTGSSNTPITTGLIGLLPNTVYHYRIKLAVGGNNYYSVDSTFKTKTTTAVQGAVAGNKLMIYPNPSSGIVHLNLPDSWKGATVRVFNTTGALVFNSTIAAGGLKTVNLEQLPAGIYDLRVGFQNQTLNSAITITH